MALLHTCLQISTIGPQNLSFSISLTTSNPLYFPTKLTQLKLTTPPSKTTTIRMGGGPRTYPGGVSKWQWKRMQAKKAKQLLKARLCRERQIYEMRKRAELKAAVAELERPWEVVERAPNLFSVRADEQLKVLADRFQRPGGFDMWSERDGPQLFEPVDGVPSARFFPKGVVHSIKPYQPISGSEPDSNGENGGEMVVQRNGYRDSRRSSRSRLKSGSISDSEADGKEWENSDVETSSEIKSKSSVESGRNGNKFRKKGNRRRFGSVDSKGSDSRQVHFDSKQRNESNVMGGINGRFRRAGGSDKKGSNSEVYDMSLRQDGSYGF